MMVKVLIEVHVFLLIIFFLFLPVRIIGFFPWLLFQRDTTGLTTENTELKLRLQDMEQQAQLRDGMFLALSLIVNWSIAGILSFPFSSYYLKKKDEQSGAEGLLFLWFVWPYDVSSSFKRGTEERSGEAEDGHWGSNYTHWHIQSRDAPHPLCQACLLTSVTTAFPNAAVSHAPNQQFGRRGSIPAPSHGSQQFPCSILRDAESWSSRPLTGPWHQ